MLRRLRSRQHPEHPSKDTRRLNLVSIERYAGLVRLRRCFAPAKHQNGRKVVSALLALWLIAQNLSYGQRPAGARRKRGTATENATKSPEFRAAAQWAESSMKARPVCCEATQVQARNVVRRNGLPDAFQALARPAWRASRRKSGASTTTVRHISNRRERIRAPIRSASVSSFTTTRRPSGSLAAGIGDSDSSK